MSFIVGLTGGIGSGKSTISKYFRDLSPDICVIDVDQIAKSLQEPGKAGYLYIKQAFGDSIVNFDGTLNRDMLRTIVFNDKEAKAKLELIMSPLIYHVVTEMIEEISRKKTFLPWPRYFVLDIPLLLENKIFSKLVDRVLVVDCPETTQVERVMKRNNLSKRQVEKIMAAQSPRYFRIMKADDVIQNYECEPEDNIKVVTELDKQYSKMAEEKSKIPE